MKKITIFALFMSLLMLSCRGSQGADIESLTLTASAEKMWADGEDVITLKVVADGVDVSSDATFEVAYQEPATRTEDSLWGAVEGNSFKTLLVGTHTFRATYKGVESNLVTVEALEKVASSQFERHVSIMYFTYNTCTFCPSGYRVIGVQRQINKALDKVLHVLAMHCSSTSDPMYLPVADELHAASGTKLKGTPAYWVDMTYGGLLNGEDANALPGIFAAQMNDKSLHGDVAVAVSYDEATRQGSAEVEVFAENNDTYRVALYVLEDGVVGYQKDGLLESHDYVHHSVVRTMLSESWRGDVVGTLGIGQQSEKRSYSFTVSEDWNAEKVTVVALLIDSKGVVRNCNECALGATSPYRYKNND